MHASALIAWPPPDGTRDNRRRRGDEAAAVRPRQRARVVGMAADAGEEARLLLDGEMAARAGGAAVLAARDRHAGVVPARGEQRLARQHAGTITACFQVAVRWHCAQSRGNAGCPAVPSWIGWMSWRT